MPKPKIYSIVAGGLGNQLFCYAAARSVALRRGADLVLDRSLYARGTDGFGRMFHLDHFAGPQRFRKVSYRTLVEKATMRAVRYAGRKWPNPLYRCFRERGIADYEEAVFSERSWRMDLMGFFQSEKYFADCADTILDELSCDWTWSAEGQNYLKAVQAEPNPVCCHFRSYTDVKNPQHRRITAPDHYRNYIALITARFPDAKFFVFADEFAGLDLDEIFGVYPYVCVDYANGQGELMGLENLLLMSHAKHFINAISSYSWWACYLSQKYHGRWEARGARVAAFPASDLVFGQDYIPAFATPHDFPID